MVALVADFSHGFAEIIPDFLVTVGRDGTDLRDFGVGSDLLYLIF
jgi:hypothetical protein